MSSTPKSFISKEDVFQFEKVSANHSVICFSQRIEGLTIDNLFPHVDNLPHVYWRNKNSGDSFLGINICKSIKETSGDRYRSVENAIDDIFSSCFHYGIEDSELPPLRIFGGFSFFTSHIAEDMWKSFPSALFFLPEIVLQESEGHDCWLTISININSNLSEDKYHEKIQSIIEWIHSLKNAKENMPMQNESPIVKKSNKQKWISLVEKAKEIIRLGGFTKVVLARKLSLEFLKPKRISTVMKKLNTLYPSCYQFSFAPIVNQSFFGSTPEMLIRHKNSMVETEALAGSIERGENEIEDNWLEKSLLNSAKNRHEHQLVVEAIKDQLHQLSVGEIENSPISVRKLANIQHLQQKIELKEKSKHSIFKFVETLHPTPALGGIPRIPALAFIQHSEKFERGWYGGPIGYVDENGDGLFVVGIRSGVKVDKQVNIFAGAGIVADSDAGNEWDETHLKFAPLNEGLTSHD